MRLEAGVQQRQGEPGQPGPVGAPFDAQTRQSDPETRDPTLQSWPIQVIRPGRQPGATRPDGRAWRRSGSHRRFAPAVDSVVGFRGVSDVRQSRLGHMTLNATVVGDALPADCLRQLARGSKVMAIKAAATIMGRSLGVGGKLMGVVAGDAAEPTLARLKAPAGLHLFDMADRAGFRRAPPPSTNTTRNSSRGKPGR